MLSCIFVFTTMILLYLVSSVSVLCCMVRYYYELMHCIMTYCTDLVMKFLSSYVGLDFALEGLRKPNQKLCTSIWQCLPPSHLSWLLPIGGGEPPPARSEAWKINPLVDVPLLHTHTVLTVSPSWENKWTFKREIFRNPTSNFEEFQRAQWLHTDKGDAALFFCAMCRARSGPQPK